MICRDCNHWNPEDEQRCVLCGRKLRSAGNDATSDYALSVVRGNLATKPQVARLQRETPAPADTGSAQRPLFPDRPASKVIQFDVRTSLSRMAFQAAAAAAPVPDAPMVAVPAQAPVRQQTRGGQIKRTPRKVEDQHEFNFHTAPVAQRAQRNLVPTSIYCDAPVATLTHRAVAGAVDTCLILIGFGLYVTSYVLMGGALPVNRLGYLTFAAAFGIICLFYGSIWALAQTETPGMRWTRLRLTNFDGFQPDPGQRALRYFATTLSFATCGFGLLWALFDEEGLTWQDHISETFPTFQRTE